MMMRLFWWLPALLLLSANLSAQAGIMQPCESDALSVTFQAADGPDHNYTLAINKRNISAETCFVDSHPGGTGISPDPAPDGSRVKTCYYCEAGQQKPIPTRITLAPGDSVHETRGWKTSPADASAQCITPTEMTWDAPSYGWNRYIRLSSAALLKPICSALAITDFAAGPLFVEPAESSNAPRIQWDNEGEVSSRDPILLRVRVEGPGHNLLLDEHSCPRLFVRVPRVKQPSTIPTRVTYFDEVRNVTCRLEAGDRGKHSSFLMEFDAGYFLAHDPKMNGEFSVNVSALAEVQGHYSLAGTATDLHLSMIDGKFIQRNWGPTVEGLAVALNLDQNSYEVGSEIPLHIALENVSSRSLITSPVGVLPEYLWVRVFDSNGLPVQPGNVAWTGNGAACGVFIQSQVRPVDLKLSQWGFQLKRPGEYTALVTWSAFKNVTCGLGFPPASRIEVKSAPVTFRMTAPPN